MTSTSRFTRRLLAAGGAIVLVAGLSTYGLPASAATVPQTYSVAGSITVGPPPAVVLPAGSTITFDLDETTGAITNGATSIPTFLRGGSGPQAAIIITDAAPFTGNLNSTTGAATVSFSFNVRIGISETVICDLAGPVNIEASTANPGGSPLSGGTATVTAAAISIPAVVEGPSCDASVVSAANDLLSLPDSAASATFTVTNTTPAPAPTPEPTPATPSFTG
jgi:hypothetical protein